MDGRSPSKAAALTAKFGGKFLCNPLIYVAVRCLFGFGAALAALHDYK